MSIKIKNLGNSLLLYPLSRTTVLGPQAHNLVSHLFGVQLKVPVISGIL